MKIIELPAQYCDARPASASRTSASSFSNISAMVLKLAWRSFGKKVEGGAPSPNQRWRSVWRASFQDVMELPSVLGS